MTLLLRRSKVIYRVIELSALSNVMPNFPACFQLQYPGPTRRVSLSASCGVHTTSYRQQSIKKELVCISKVERTVKHYGYVELSNVDLDLLIRSADPDRYPDANKAVCSFYSQHETEQLQPDFIQEEEKLSLVPKKSHLPKESLCHLEVPLKYDIDSTNLLGQNSVHIQSMESNSIRISTGSGDITSKNIKGDYISLLSQSGNITCQAVSQGRIVVQTGSGDIHGHKFQGPSLRMATATGNIGAESVYSDESFFVTATGNVTLKNLHRKSNVKITGSGNLTISGMDGTLDAQLGKGRHQIQISQLSDNSVIKVVGGSLTLRVPEQCPFGIRIKALSILSLPERMAALGVSSIDPHTESRHFEYQTSRGTAVIDVEVSKDGQVMVEHQDWISSLGLGWKE